MKIQVNAAILYATSFVMLFAAAIPARAKGGATVPTPKPGVTAFSKAVKKPTVVASGNALESQVIVVSLQDRELALLENGQVKVIYPVAVGKPSTPSPTGIYTIVNHVKDPTYYHHGVVIPPGRWNPVGNRWMGLSVAGYGIHGTDVQSSVGKAVSHGCIRLRRADIEALFAQVRVGDRVEIFAQRNQETVAIFGSPEALPANHLPAMDLAKSRHENAVSAKVTETAEMTKPMIPSGR
jgi:lipoprotein-anchoring transpeptidase ErfK/SrfK